MEIIEAITDKLTDSDIDQIDMPMRALIALLE